MINAIVLAAGLSKRMGNDNKLLLPYKGKTIIATTVENIIASGIDHITVVAGFERNKIKEALEAMSVQLIDNPGYEKGMTTSIQKGVASATGNGYMICLGDMVHITPSEYALLARSFDDVHAKNEACIILPFYKGEKGNPVIFSSHYRDAILGNTDMEGCKNIVRDNKHNMVAVEMDTSNILLDLDYPADYEKLSNI